MTALSERNGEQFATKTAPYNNWAMLMVSPEYLTGKMCTQLKLNSGTLDNIDSSF